MKSKIIIISVIAVAILIIFGIFALNFLIGEPIDGGQLNTYIKFNGENTEITVSSHESAVALRGWKVKKEGETLTISGRKVTVSPFFDGGKHTITVDTTGVKTIIIGGKTVWTAEE